MQHENFDVDGFLSRNLLPEQNDPNYDDDKYYNTNEVQGMYFVQSKMSDTKAMDLRKELESLDQTVRGQFKTEIELAFKNFYRHDNLEAQDFNFKDLKNEEDLKDITKEKLKKQRTLSEMNLNYRIWNSLFSLLNNHSFLIDLPQSIDLFIQLKQDIRECQQNTINLLQGNKTLQNKKVLGELQQKFHYRYGGCFKDFFMGIEFEKVVQYVLFLLYLVNHYIEIYETEQEICVEFQFESKIKKKKLFKDLQQQIEQKLGYNIDIFVENLQNKQFLFKNIEEDYYNQKIVMQIDKNNLQNIFSYENTCYIDKDGKLFYEKNLFELHATWLFTNCLDENYISLTSAYRYYKNSVLNFIGLQLNLNKKTLQIINRQAQTHIALTFNKQFNSKDDNQLRMYRSFSVQQKMTEIKNDILILVKIFQNKLDFDNIEQFCESLEKHLINISTNKQKLNMDSLNLQQELTDTKKQFIKNLLKDYFEYNIRLKQCSIINKFINNPQNLLIIKQLDQSILVETLNQSLDKFMHKIENLQSKKFTDLNTFQGLKDYLFYSKKVKDNIVKFAKGQQQILQKAVCFYNLNIQWNFLKEQINELLTSQSEIKLNQKVPDHLKFQMQNNRIKLHSQTDKDVKQTRGFKSEHVISGDSIKKIFPYVKQMHWKVQNGLFFWFNVFIERQLNYREILTCFEKMNIKQIHSRQTAIKYFGAFSKFFKFVKHFKSIKDYQNFFETIQDPCLKCFLSVESEAFIDLDSIFGYSETTKEENIEWDKDFVYHLYEWLNRDTRENLFGLDTTYDFKLNLELIMRDQKITNSMFSKLDENRIFVYVEKNYKIDQFNNIFPFQVNYAIQSNKSFKPQNQNFVLPQNDEEIPIHFVQQSYENNWKYTYKTFKQTTSNYLNYKATGSVQSFKIEKRKTDMFKKLQENEPELCKKALEALQSKDGPKKSTKSVSKTTCFSYTGESLIKLLYWVYGQQEYKPLYTLFLKREPKKIRHVINSDLSSFVKQTYFHDWMKNVLNCKIKERINSLMDPQQRVLFYKRSQITGPSEKWCVELDLKDFHHHFGKSHYQAISEVLSEKVEQYVSCEYIKKDLQKTLTEFSDELCKGRVVFNIKSQEKNLFEKYMKDLDKGSYQKCYCRAKKMIIDGKEVYSYTLEFEISNGLMSGWKLTSMLGSLFNITLNKMCEQWTQMMSQDILYNENVLGDDTHLKKRFLIGSISHINFVNQIGKIAHPQKQMVSTTILEYLKKKINTVTKTTQYSNLTSLNTILYRKKNKSPVISKTDIQDCIDLFNLFLSRVTIQKSVNYVINQKYFHKYIQGIANFSNDKYKKEETNISKLLNTPVLISGAVAGHLRSLKINFEQKNKIDMIDSVIQFQTPDKFMVNQINLTSGQCRGLQSNANKIVSNLGMQNKIRSSALRVEIISAQFSQLIESTAEYYQLKTKQHEQGQKDNSQVTFINYRAKIEANKKLLYKNGKLSRQVGSNKSDFFCKILDKNELQLLGKQNEYFNVYLFNELMIQYLEYAIKGNVQFAGLIGELVYCDRQVSQSLYSALKDNYNLNDTKQSQYYYNQIYRNLSSLKGNSSLTQQLRFEFLRHFNNQTFFYFALNDCLQVSVSQKFVHPDLIGYINSEFSKYLIHYILLNPLRKVIIPVKDLKKVFKKIVLTVDYYINQNFEQINERINTILEEKIESQF